MDSILGCTNYFNNSIKAGKCVIGIFWSKPRVKTHVCQAKRDCLQQWCKVFIKRAVYKN